MNRTHDPRLRSWVESANDPASEFRIAAGEQAKITRLRLEKLVTT